MVPASTRDPVDIDSLKVTTMESAFPMRELLAGEALAEALAAAEFVKPEIRVIAASNAEPYGDGDDIRARLSRQVYAPVRWVETINAMLGGGADSIIECGPGKVLAGLMRRIDKSVASAYIDSTDSLQTALQGKE